jgi:cytochrome c peroxidase
LPRRRLALFLFVFLVPFAVLTTLAIRTLNQDRGLAVRREEDDRRRVAAAVRQEFLGRLEGVKLRAASSALDASREDRAEDLHNTGVGWGRDAGRFEVTDLPQDRGRFKTPGLRDVGLTAPYMHDGSLATLEAVVEFYDRGGRGNPNLDPAIRPLRLTFDQRSDLVAFLRALQGEIAAKR